MECFTQTLQAGLKSARKLSSLKLQAKNNYAYTEIVLLFFYTQNLLISWISSEIIVDIRTASQRLLSFLTSNKLP